MLQPNYNLVYVELIEEEIKEEVNGIFVGKKKDVKAFKKGTILAVGILESKYSEYPFALEKGGVGGVGGSGVGGNISVNKFKEGDIIIFNDIKIEIEKGKYIIHAENILAKLTE